MNERIKELADEAAKFSAVMALPTGESGDKLFVEKFAELIVRECIDIISPYTIRMGRPGEEYLHPIQEIKTHFGMNDEQKTTQAD